MYSILIVDDESIILEGLLEVISASDLPFKEVKTAKSAGDALELFARSPFDILLSDISMPEMDGLAMAERMKRIWPSTSVIFLTGYQDFQYARRALQLGSVDYLLKPVMDEQLLECLGNLVEQLDRGWFNRFHAGGNKWEMDYSVLEGLNHFFYDALAHGTGAWRREYLEQAGIPLQADRKVRMLVIRYGGRVGERTENRTHLWLMNILQKVVYGIGWVTGFQYETNCSVFLLQPEAGREMDTVFLMKETEEMQSYFFEQLDMPMSIGLTESFALPDMRRELERVLSDKDMDEASGALSLCAVSMDEGAGRQGVSVEGAGRQGAADEGVALQDENRNYMVQRVEEYIRQNPGEDLSLGALSARFRINPSYLSRTFHQTLGVQLSVFIVKIRMEESKRLLRETDDRIYEISRKVGFDTPGYFAKVFSRMEKISPKEYRAQIPSQQ